MLLTEYVRQYKVIIENKLRLNFVLTSILILNDSPIEIEKKKSILKSNLHWIMLMIQLSKYLLSPFLNTPQPYEPAGQRERGGVSTILLTDTIHELYA